MPVVHSAAVARAEQRKLRLAKARAERDRRAKAKLELAAETKATIAAARPTKRQVRERGNIDVSKRPPVRNKDGSVSTVRSISIGTDRGEVLIPTVVRGKVVSDKAARAYYEKTGEHLGVYSTPQAATRAAKSLHRSEEKRVGHLRKNAVELKQETRATIAAARPVVERKPSPKETPEQKAKRLGVPYLGKAKPPSAYANRATKRLFEPKPEKPHALTAKEKANERKASRLGTKTIRALSKDQHSAAMSLAGRVPFIEKKDVAEAEQAVLGMPAGLYGIAKALALDVVKPKGGPFDVRHSRTGKLAKEIGTSVKRDIRHPLRNPLLTFIDVSGAASAGAGTVTRVGAAAGAAKVARAAGKSAPKAAAKAAIKRPLPGVRTHYYEGQPIRGRYSLNPSARAIQKAHDKRTGGKIGARKDERMLSEERRVTDAAAKAPHLRAQAEAPRHLTTHQILAKFGKRDITTPQDMAIRVYAEGVPVQDVIEAHLRAAAVVEKQLTNKRRGGVPGGGKTSQTALRFDRSHRELLRKAAILEESKRYLDVGEDGRPIITDPELARKTGITEESALTREARLKKAGLLSRESAESRVQAPGRQMVRTVSGGRAVKTERPRTIEEAQVRADELTTLVEKAISKIAKEKQKGPEAFTVKGGVRKRSKKTQIGMSDKQRRSDVGGGAFVEPTAGDYAPYQPKRTGVQQAHAWAAENIYQFGTKEGAHPTLKRLADAMDELEQLRAAIHEQTAPAFAREAGAPQGSLGSVSEFKGMQDYEQFVGGRFRVPDVLRSKKLPHGPAAYRGGIPRKPGTLTHGYTGALRRSGKYTSQTIRAVAEDSLEAERYLSVERFRNRILPMGKKVRPEDTRAVKWAPLRTRKPTQAEATQLRKTMQEADIERMTPDEAARVETTVQNWERDLFPEEGRDIPRYAPGASIPGIVWVDKRLLSSQTKLIRGDHPVLRAIDTFQDAIKGLILYGKPGYVTPNVLGNIGFNLMQQGFLAPLNWNRAAHLPRDLAFMIDEVMGQGFSRALAEGTSSPISHTVRVAGNFWSRFVDTPFRRAAFIHEARRMGFTTHEQMRSLIMEERFRGDIGEIGQRGRDAIVDYERLGPLERDLVRRVLFVYPWIKGSTYYGVQFLRDHPIQAAVLTKIGQQGADTALQELGPMPAYAQGSFKVGGSEDKPLTINPAAASNFGTPIQVAQTLGSLFGNVEQSQNIGEYTSPTVQAALEASFSKDFFSGRDLEGSWPQKFAGQIVKGLPQVLLYQRLRDASKPATQEKTYPYTKQAAIGSFVGGSSYPRPTNRKMLNEQAAGSRPTARAKLQAELKVVLPALKGKVSPADEKFIRRAYSIAGGMVEIREKASESNGDGEPYYRAVLAAEAEYMGKLGIFPKADVAFLVELASSGTYDQVRKRRDALIQGPYEKSYLLAKRNAKKIAGYKEP